jgi:hypothetical protein
MCMCLARMVGSRLLRHIGVCPGSIQHCMNVMHCGPCKVPCLPAATPATAPRPPAAASKCAAADAARTLAHARDLDRGRHRRAGGPGHRPCARGRAGHAGWRDARQLLLALSRPRRPASARAAGLARAQPPSSSRAAWSRPHRPAPQLRDVITLPFRGRAAARAARIELAIRAWARRDDMARQRWTRPTRRASPITCRSSPRWASRAGSTLMRAFLLYSYEVAESVLHRQGSGGAEAGAQCALCCADDAAAVARNALRYRVSVMQTFSPPRARARQGLFQPLQVLRPGCRVAVAQAPERNLQTAAAQFGLQFDHQHTPKPGSGRQRPGARRSPGFAGCHPAPPARCSRHPRSPAAGLPRRR